MNSKQGLGRIIFLYEEVKRANEFIKNGAGNSFVLQFRKEKIEESKRIYEEFKDGCDNKLCIGNCSNCQKINYLWLTIKEGEKDK